MVLEVSALPECCRAYRALEWTLSAVSQKVGLECRIVPKRSRTQAATVWLFPRMGSQVCFEVSRVIEGRRAQVALVRFVTWVHPTAT